MPTIQELAELIEKADALVKVARKTYPHATNETLKSTCENALAFALFDDQNR